MAIDPAGRHVLGTPAKKFADAPELDLVQWASEHGWRLHLEHDARAALAGEMASGCLKGVDNAAVMLLGTGIGVAVACEGRLLRGGGQASLMFGHLPQISPIDQPCSCGRVGCAESLAGAGAFRRDHIAWPPQGPDASQHRQQAVRIWGQVLDAVAIAYDPTHIAIGGGLLTAAPELIFLLSAELVKKPRLYGAAPSLLPTQLGESAPMLGLAATCLTSYGLNTHL